MDYTRVLFLVLVYYVLNSFCVAGTTRRLLNSNWTVADEGCRTPDYGVGTCIPIFKCKIIYDFINKSDELSDTVKNEIKEYACGFDGTNVKVCCPSKLPAHWTATVEMLDHSQHRNIQLLPRSDCGISGASNKFINGNMTELLEYPWAALLKYQRAVNPFSCGGSLISKRYVLTAAHCIRSRSKLISVRIGEYNVTTEIDCIENFQGPPFCSPPHEDFNITANDIIVHPGYNSATLVNDIALIRLPRDANINGDNIRPICLPITKEQKAKEFPDYLLIGWGANRATSFGSNVLLQVKVPKVPLSVCAPIYEVIIQVTDNHLCAGGKAEKDSCAGDSGGPLANAIATDEGPTWFQYGIVSVAPRICGRENFPAVFTKVVKYVGWILDNIKE